jgi:hypothetical protein
MLHNLLDLWCICRFPLAGSLCWYYWRHEFINYAVNIVLYETITMPRSIGIYWRTQRKWRVLFPPSSTSFPFPFVPLQCLGCLFGTFYFYESFSTLCGWSAQRQGCRVGGLPSHGVSANQILCWVVCFISCVNQMDLKFRFKNLFTIQFSKLWNCNGRIEIPARNTTHSKFR